MSTSSLFGWPEAITKLLLIDQSTGDYLLFNTDSYAQLGAEFGRLSPMSLDLGEQLAQLLKPRMFKDASLQKARTKVHAEVFTPAWVCNEQNNAADAAWFGREGVFNTLVAQANGSTTWVSTTTPIEFADSGSKTWQAYVMQNCLELCCGEAPYLVSRVDVVQNVPIALEQGLGS